MTSLYHPAPDGNTTPGGWIHPLRQAPNESHSFVPMNIFLRIQASQHKQSHALNWTMWWDRHSLFHSQPSGHPTLHLQRSLHWVAVLVRAKKYSPNHSILFYLLCVFRWLHHNNLFLHWHHRTILQKYHRNWSAILAIGSANMSNTLVYRNLHDSYPKANNRCPISIHILYMHRPAHGSSLLAHYATAHS